MRLDDVMSRNPVLVAPEDKVVEAARSMGARRVSSALVVDGGGGLVGIVTERDMVQGLIAEGLSPDGVTVGELMTKDPITAPASMGTWQALSLMTVKGIRHLPIVEGGRPTGVVSMRDLMGASSAEITQVEDRLALLDDGGRRRLAEILLWAAGQTADRRDEFPGFPGEE